MGNAHLTTFGPALTYSSHCPTSCWTNNHFVFKNQPNLSWYCNYADKM